jgi:hypothetical protein
MSTRDFVFEDSALPQPDLNLSDIAPLNGPRPNGSERVRRRPAVKHEFTRRRFVQYTLAAGAGVGLAVLGVFPQVREARADGYDIWPNCNGIGYSDCTSCCCSMVCSNCCTTSSWHKDSSYAGYDLRPNVCVGGGGTGGQDGWIWHVCTSGCSGGAKKKYRCHDGWWIPDWEPVETICVLSYGCV